jgi:hypothetical protein
MAAYGRTKVGKTWFAATAPKPVFICAAQERGWSALPSHPNYANITVLPVPLVEGQEELGGDARPPSKDYKATRRPDLVVDIRRAIERVVNEYQQRGWRTVVIDTATVICGMLVSQLSEYGKREMGGKGGGQWNTLTQELTMIRNTLQGLPLHVIWTFHEVMNEDLRKIKPALTGKNYDTVIAPAVRLCAYLTYRQVPVMDENEQPIMLPNGRVKYEPQRGLWVSCPGEEQPQFETGTSFEHLFTESDLYRPHWDTLAKRLQGVVRVD